MTTLKLPCNLIGDFKLTIHKSMTYPFVHAVLLQGMDMRILSVSQRNSTRTRHPCLCPPPHHTSDTTFIPKAIISERIDRREIRWGSTVHYRGEISFLSKFWEWSLWIHKLLIKKNLLELAHAVYSATKDYFRPDSIYRALCEVWCPETNTFVTANGEISISLWDMQEITGLSIRGDYYEEVVPSLLELTDSLPRSCLYLFKAFSLIVDKKKSERVRHSDWIDFWFKTDDCVPNPRKSKAFKQAMEANPSSGDQSVAKENLQRPVCTETLHDILHRDTDYWNTSLSIEEQEELDIAAYISLWLFRFIFPSRDDCLRVGTFKVASRMATKSTYSLVPPILACIYRGLTETTNCVTGHDIGSVKYTFPGHFLYAWAATYFVRGIYANVDKSIGRPIIRRYAGTLNDFQHWEVDAFDCRELLRGKMDSNDFSWNPTYLPHGGIRTDNNERSIETSEFMMSIRPGFLSYRRGNNLFILEAYNPHRFARQQGFRQTIPGSPKPMMLTANALTLYHAWLSLTQVGSRCFHLPGRIDDIQLQVDPSYEAWWEDKVYPGLNKIKVQDLLSSEDNNFVLGKSPSAPEQTGSHNARELDSSYVDSQVTLRKRHLDVPNERGIKKIKIIHSRMDYTSTSEHVEKVHEPITISESSSSMDRTPQTLDATLPLESSSPRDQIPLSQILRRKRTIRPKDSQVVENPKEACSETFRHDLSIPDVSYGDENLDMSPQTRNAGFPQVPEGMFYSADHRNENHEMIGALDEIYGNDRHEPPCKYPSSINNGVISPNQDDLNDEVNSEPLRVSSSEIGQDTSNTSSLLALPAPGQKINNCETTPICSSISGPLHRFTEESSFLKNALQEAKINFLRALFKEALKHGFSNIRTWWNESKSTLRDVIINQFRADPMPLMRHMDVFLGGVDVYLVKRQQYLECLTAEEKAKQLKSLDIQIAAGNSTCSSLEARISDLNSELDRLRDELQTCQENTNSLETKKTTLEQAQVKDATFAGSIDQERKALEDNFLQLIDSD